MDYREVRRAEKIEAASGLRHVCGGGRIVKTKMRHTNGTELAGIARCRTEESLSVTSRERSGTNFKNKQT
jgi:hypothetical protein